jgi:transcription antitermination factor NusG
MNERKALSRWFEETANWFVIFVRTREEQRIAERLQKKLDTEKYNVFVPTRDYAYTKNSKTTIIKKPLFDGYLFIAAMVDAGEFRKTVEPLFYIDPDIYKLLSNADQLGNIILAENDKAFMTKMLDTDFNMPSLKAVVEGDWVQVNNGVLPGLDAKVVNVNKRRKTATLSILFAGKRTDCEIALEFVSL